MAGLPAAKGRALAWLASGLLTMATTGLAACQAPEPGKATAPAPAPTVAPPSPAADVQRIAPLPALEYFETLTEEAFDAPPARLDVLIVQARAAASRDRLTLSPDAAAAMDRRLDEVVVHRAAGDRAELALSSIEGFRLFVAAAPASDPVPVAVSLLDYAGFRYVADLKAAPARWDDALAAADFADGRWGEIEARVADPVLKRRFADAVAGLKAAVVARDAAQAIRAGTHELDLVDELETYFTGHPG